MVLMIVVLQLVLSFQEYESIHVVQLHNIENYQQFKQINLVKN